MFYNTKLMHSIHQDLGKSPSINKRIMLINQLNTLTKLSVQSKRSRIKNKLISQLILKTFFNLKILINDIKNKIKNRNITLIQIKAYLKL